eukprot:TRINITY_DN6110_c0_g2_i2.p1 TRINITY_DN6110_c0_g2~~TRINITY_DN6110_c0_g2_i2.p1  ORF type:complete len:673 (-),score=48.10 TRINITY_DN6110_c0_g2_i2:283-2301(-)
MKNDTNEVAKLKKQIDDLVAQRNHLQEQLLAQQKGSIIRSGYLNKYKNYQSSLFSSQWESRFFTLIGNSLCYYRSEKDAQFYPRGRLSVKGCILEWEGLKAGRYWTFAIVDGQSMCSLIRLSIEDKSDADSWCSALQAAGCHLKVLSNVARQMSPPPPLYLYTSSNNSQPQEKRWNHNSRYDSDSDQSDISHSSNQVKNGGKKVRHKRTPSSKLPPMVGSTPLHTECRFSYLSSERLSYEQHSGLINLMMVIVLAANSRLVLENIIKYGLRFNPVRWFNLWLGQGGQIPLLLCFPGIMLLMLLIFSLERVAAKRVQWELQERENWRKKSEEYAKRKAQSSARFTQLIVALNLILVAFVLIIPVTVIMHTESDLIPGIILMMCSVVLFMKLLSFCHCNWDLRRQFRKGELDHEVSFENNIESVQYPDNLRLKPFIYFVFAPTLVYQLSYPRSSRFRRNWLLRRVVEFVVYLSLMMFIVEQYIEPTIANSLKPLRDLNWMLVCERVLKLALPWMYVWLCMFYVFFHVWLNILAELLRFGDREFYKDWWNATTIGEYWRLWNMPVHKWLLRTVYFPAVRKGIPKFFAGLITFFISAVFHELIIGVPLHMLRGWAFWGMLAQVPLVFISEWMKKKFKSDQMGNIMFWVLFCVVGQPMILLLYYHDWAIENRPDLLL